MTTPIVSGVYIFIYAYLRVYVATHLIQYPFFACYRTRCVPFVQFTGRCFHSTGTSLAYCIHVPCCRYRSMLHSFVTNAEKAVATVSIATSANGFHIAAPSPTPRTTCLAPDGSTDRNDNNGAGESQGGMGSDDELDLDNLDDAEAATPTPSFKTIFELIEAAIAEVYPRRHLVDSRTMMECHRPSSNRGARQPHQHPPPPSPFP